MKYSLLLFLFFLFISCKNASDENDFSKVELVYVASNENEVVANNITYKGDFITLKLLKNYYKEKNDTLSWSKSIYITLPKKENSFVFLNDSQHQISSYKSSKKGLCKIVPMTVKSTLFEGKKIEKLTWSIKIENPEFTLDKIIKFELDTGKTIRLK
jgi:hypothetical protein